MPKPHAHAPSKQGFLHSDGTLKIVQWAQDYGVAHLTDQDYQVLEVPMGERPVHMAHSPATGESLVTNEALGADVIRLAAGDGFAPHTHPGDHLLIILAGSGTITYDGKIYPTEAGQIYMIEGSIPHAVGAITDHVILAVGAPHKPVDSPDRMTVVEYEAIAAEIQELHCLICDKSAALPQRLHDINCLHCPCTDCHPIPD